MIVYVDIDNTICRTSGEDYPDATPTHENIKKINILYDHGHIIHYWTARGSVSGIDWYQLTQSQLDMWGCKYHHLHMGKPPYDLLIDDRAKRIEEL